MNATSALAQRLRWVGAIGIATIAVMRCVVFFVPKLVFDVDPVFDPSLLGGLGPAGSLWLDAALLVAAAAALLGETLQGRGVDRVLLVLALAPWPVVLWHGLTDAGDLWRGSTWAAASLAGVAVAHLARDPALRSVLAVLLASVVGVLLVRGAANVTYEYAENIALFEAQKAEILADKGWEEGSPYALIFERRVRKREPTGWFVTTNIFAGVLAFGLLVGAGLVVAAHRGGQSSGWVGLWCLVTLATGAGLWMTGSKGALLAALAGAVLLTAALARGPWTPLVRRFGGAIAIACVVAALLGVVVRGAVLPEGFAGERSLLFRWHYMISSSSIVAEHPLVGVGPDGYQPAYVRHRVPRNPEEVASAHSMFWDWLAMLGVLGVAWIGLAGVLLARAGTRLGAPDATTPAEAPDPGVGGRTLAASIGAVALFGLVPAIVVELHTLYALGITVRALGLLAFVGMAFALAATLRAAAGRAGGRAEVAAIVAAGAIALAVQGQIEMTFGQAGTVVWLMCVLGLAGGAARPRDDRPRPAATAIGLAGAAVALATAAWIVGTGAVPATRQETRMIDAARHLWPLALDRATGPAGGPREHIDRRRAAADMLIEAEAAWPTARAPRLAAAGQLYRAARIARGEERIALLEGALAHAMHWVERGTGEATLALAISARRDLARMTTGADRAAHRTEALALLRLAIERDPEGLAPHQRLGDALWEYGRFEEARMVYERTLEIDDNNALDPLKQLPGRDRAAIETRLRERRDG